MLTLTRNDDGSIAIIAALMIVILVSLIGLSVDYGRATSTSSHVQGALDSAALAGGRAALLSRNTPQSAAQQTITNYWAQGKPQNSGVVSSEITTSITDANTKFTVEATTVIKTPFKSAVGLLVKRDTSTMTIKNKAVSVLRVPGTLDLEVALVLDLSGSMSGAALDALKTASKDLIDIVIPDAPDYQARVALVPFSSAVNVQTSQRFKALTNHEDLDQLQLRCAPNGPLQCNPNDPQYKIKYLRWCVSPRPSQYTMEGPPLLNSAATYLNTLNHETNYQGTSTECTPNLQTVFVPLTKNREALKMAVDRMEPGGQTDLQMGVSFGFFALSPLWSTIWGSEAGAAWDASRTRKLLILITDGAAQLAGSQRTPATIKARTQVMCSFLKTKPGALVYVVFNSWTNGADTNIKACATTPAHVYDIADQGGVPSALRDIALKVSTLKLSN